MLGMFMKLIVAPLFKACGLISTPVSHRQAQVIINLLLTFKTLPTQQPSKFLCCS